MDSFIDFLKPLEIVDSPEGIKVNPKPSSGSKLKLHIGVASIGDVASVTAYFTREALLAIPPHKGELVNGGELWKVEQGVSVLLANDSVAIVMAPMAHANDPAFASIARSLKVTRALNPALN